MSFKMLGRAVALAVATVVPLLAGAAQAQQRTLTVYSSLDEDQAKALIRGFEAKHPQVKVNAILGSTAPIIARVIAEAAAPQGDVIMGNAVSALMAADARGLLLPYKPAHFDKVSPMMRDGRAEPVWVGIDAWAASVCFNTAEAAKKNIPAPVTWEDLTKPIYRGQITMPSPLSSGTALLAVNGWLTAFGEQAGWAYMDRLHENVARYGHSGSAPCRQAATGESLIGISYAAPGVKLINEGAPISIILPTEGLGWEIEALAIIKGARNLADAKVMADWISSREAAEISAKFLPITAYDDIQSLPKNYPANEREKLLKMDFGKLAASREAVMAEWQRRYGTKVPPRN
ncbi:MAG: extracellular solute-binding protein [Alphaproteobacteria bacterium]|nr:extracellular solute-binding protein [Alphaproteobacteria bacterium]